jgi:hypothetical protein
MAVHLLDGTAERRIGSGQSNAVEDETDGRRLDALEGVGHCAQLRAGGDASFDHYDRAVSGAHKMLSFLGGGERRGISENDLASGAFGLAGQLLKRREIIAPECRFLPLATRRR